MFLFFLGAMLGCSLGIIVVALLMKSKEADEAVCEIIREAPLMVEDNLLTTR
jgi:predicted small secreted protein